MNTSQLYSQNAQSIQQLTRDVPSDSATLDDFDRVNAQVTSLPETGTLYA